MIKYNSNKHILIVSQYFYPESIRINDIAKEFANKGFKVTVLTGIPNYPEGIFFKGYSWRKKRKEIWNGISIIRIPILSRGKSKLKLFLNYYSFVISGKLWAFFSKAKFDVVFSFGTSPLFQASVARKIAKKLTAPFYLYVQDLWPDFLQAVTGIKNRIVLNHYSKVINKIYDACTCIFTTSQSFVEIIKDRTKSKVIYLPQYAEDFYRPVEKKPIDSIPSNDLFKIIFTGNIGAAQGLNVLIEAAKQLDDVQFVIVGDGRKKKEFIDNLMTVKDKFILINRKPAEEIPQLLKACDVAFLSFTGNDIFSKTIPAKLQSYMACGMPILACAYGECERIIEESKCGYCSKPNDVDGLIKNINKLKRENLELKGINAIKYSRKYFNKSKIIKILCNEINMYNK